MFDLGLSGVGSLSIERGLSLEHSAREFEINIRLVDLTHLFPDSWAEDVRRVANDAEFDWHRPTPIITREASDRSRVRWGRVEGITVMQRLPWLHKLYRDECREQAALFAGGPVECARDDRYGVVLNVQRGRLMRFECHVDSNPIAGILCFTDHLPGSGGELVIGDRSDLVGIGQIEAYGTAFRPRAGYLLIFDGRTHAHYVRALTRPGDMRIVAPMNFYTPAWPEDRRPKELNEHRFGDRP